MAKDHLAPSEIFGHVEDATFFHVPRALVPKDWHGHIAIPQPFKLNAPLFSVDTGDPLIDSNILAPDLSITKFMILEVLAAVIIAV